MNIKLSENISDNRLEEVFTISPFVATNLLLEMFSRLSRRNKIMSKIKDQNFINIQGWMINRLKLKGNELFIYAIIYGFTQDGEQWFEGSRQYLADWCNSTKQGIQKNLNSLVEKKILIKEEFMVNNVKFCKYKANLDYIVGDNTTSQQSLLPQSTKFTTPVNLVDSPLSDYIEKNNNNIFHKSGEKNENKKASPSRDTYIRTIKSERYNSSGRKVCQAPSYDLEDYEQNDDFYEMLSKRR